jgi:hypothetical protein
MSAVHLSSTTHLTTAERRFLTAMHDVGFGRFEFLRIQRGEVVLDPWPTTVRGIKFGSPDTVTHTVPPADFELKAQVAEFFEYVRSVDSGEIRCLDVRHGLPFTMEIEHRRDGRGGGRD